MKDLGILFYFATFVFLGISGIGGVITIILYLIQNKAAKLLLKISLISLLLSGVSLLLTSILCGW